VKGIGRKIIVLAALLLNPCIGEARGISFGLSLGAPMNHLATAESSMEATAGRFTFGPALRVGISRRFGLEAELLYKRLEFGFVSNPNLLTVHRLELPLMFRYILHGSAPHPFVHAGISLNRVIAVGGSDACSEGVAGEGFYCIGGKPAALLRHRHTHGFVLGGGVDFGLGVLRLAPELRITRWVDRNFGTQDSMLRSNLTQVELLVGLKF
jgi:hypothetical protein